MSLFTDRGIYRPGQTVAFKGIVYTDDKKQLTANEGETISVSLRDANTRKSPGKNLRPTLLALSMVNSSCLNKD